MKWDTADVDVDDRVGMIAGVFDALGVDCVVHHDRRPADVHAQIRTAELGVVRMFGYTGSGVRLVQDDRRSARFPEVVAVAVQGRRGGGIEQHGQRRSLQPGELAIIDHTSAYDYRWYGNGGASALHVPLELLGFPVETVRRACARVGASPLAALVAGHVRRLHAHGERVSVDVGGDGVGEATVELVRALVATAVTDDLAVSVGASEVLRAHGLRPRHAHR